MPGLGIGGCLTARVTRRRTWSAPSPTRWFWSSISVCLEDPTVRYSGRWRERSVVADGRQLSSRRDCPQAKRSGRSRPCNTTTTTTTTTTSVLPRQSIPGLLHGTTRGLGTFAAGFSFSSRGERTPVRGESGLVPWQYGSIRQGLCDTTEFIHATESYA